MDLSGRADCGPPLAIVFWTTLRFRHGILPHSEMALRFIMQLRIYLKKNVVLLAKDFLGVMFSFLWSPVRFEKMEVHIFVAIV